MMVREGLTIIFITHKLDEVFALDGHVSVLRQGKVVKTLNVTETNKSKLVRLMVGRDVLLRLKRPKVKPGKPVLKIDGLCALNNRGLQALDDITLRIREGEIFGVAGVAGNGQTELIEVISGLRETSSGTITILGKDATNHSPKYVADVGVAHIPEERIKRGLFGGLTVAENLIIGSQQDETFSNGIFLRNDLIQQHATKLIEEYNITTSGPNTPAKHLSGGNVQRLILAKKLSGKPKLIIASHPTSGLDVAATEQIRQRLLEEQKRGAAIILFSEDLNELFELSNRITVMYRGRMMGTFNVNETRIEEIGLMMTGNKN
jgi:simple sugar transport system ATP-binding protein